ncbi:MULTISPECIES: hypothetical protein [unclassified Pseudomonas]|uniref:hypothetical protein n=1 Tax=unclassified Pseudomonas TaxID=196821 RepID=UPI002447A96C|nr:hypothetical protein [Pseudomonas sp. GD03944]MDH1262763.1 hypothetical protein [Pseudomonas sp. GD03944]
MTLEHYNRSRRHADFLESLLTTLVIALLALALFVPEDELLIALAVVIGGVLVGLYRQHQSLGEYRCPRCGGCPHSAQDERIGHQQELTTPHCLHCRLPLSD